MKVVNIFVGQQNVCHCDQASGILYCSLFKVQHYTEDNIDKEGDKQSVVLFKSEGVIVTLLPL